MRSRAALFVALSLCAASALANDMNVDRRSLQMNDLLTVTVSLEGDFASADEVNVPLQNLTLIGQPWVSSEFSWINGQVVRRKVFRYRARPIAPGMAMVGPLVVNADSGQRETFEAIAVQVLPDRVPGSNEPEAVLRELLATGRDPFFIIAEADKTTAFAGEQVIVTWTLYNAASVQQWQISSVPKLEEFWAEEIDVRRAPTEQEVVGGMTMTKVPIRRVAIYPLRSGRFNVGGMALEAAVMRRVRGGPFAIFEGNLVDVAYTSAPLTIEVKPLPPGPPVDAVGELGLTCLGVTQKSGGPVVVEVRMWGRGNLRAAAAPRFAGTVYGDVQVQPEPVGRLQEGDSFVMTRPWKYLVFPAHGGTFSLPALTARVFDPSTGQRRDLRCELPPIFATAMSAPVPQTPAVPSARREAAQRRYMPWAAGAVLVALFAGVAVPRARRSLALRREVRDLVAGTPSEIRARIDARFDAATLIHEKSDRGDAYRALRSLLDAAERDRDIAVDAEEELERRVRDLLAFSPPPSS